MTDGPPDPDAIAALAAPESVRDARVRQAALQARQRRGEVREAVRTAEDRVSALARGLVNGTVVEADVVAAIRRRDDLRLRLEAWDLAVREVDAHPALRGRR